MTSSMNGWTKDPATSGFCFPYLFSKSAIGHATGTLAHELLPLGIRVNGIAPGLFLTEMAAPGSTDVLGQSRFKAWETIAFEVPSTQAPTSDGEKPVAAGSRTDMGALVLCLVSNWFINGETVLIDGGVSTIPVELARLTDHGTDPAPASFFVLAQPVSTEKEMGRHDEQQRKFEQCILNS